MRQHTGVRAHSHNSRSGGKRRDAAASAASNSSNHKGSNQDLYDVSGYG